MPLSGAQSVIGDAPLTSAYDHAAAADEYHMMNDFTRAIEEHRKAAADYLASVEYTTDSALQTTLKRMHADQIRCAEDLERRIAQMERDKTKIKNHAMPRSTYGYLSPSEHSPSRTPLHSPRSSTRRLQESVMSDRTTGSESYLFLGEEFTEAGGRFNRFWNTLEANLDNFTQAVAFTTLPLGGEMPESEPESDVPVTRHSRSSTSASVSSWVRGKGKAKETIPEPKVVELDFDEPEDSSDSDSFYLIPSSNPPSKQATLVITPSPAEKRLKDENDKLQVELEQVKARMVKAESLMKMRAGQEAQLRDSIMFAKREAQRNLLHSTTLRHPGYNLNSTAGLPPALDLNNASPFMSPLPGQSSPTPTAASTAANRALEKRLKELEEETKRLKLENTKLAAQNTRFREKWSSLKESAKKRRSMKEAQSMADGLKAMSIKEEEEDELRGSAEQQQPIAPRATSIEDGGL